MEYHEAITALFALRQFRPKPGTASTRDVLTHLGDPHVGVDYVQVAGSNGKGSTARMTESVLREAGLCVGLYTSPHFDDVRERFRINGRMIPKSAVTRYVELVGDYLTERAGSGNPVTFFEATTAMGLWYFGREGVDVAVLEVGIGGQFDATCVVDPIASAVTSVSLEHTDILGDTIEEIARDKTHVSPTDQALVTGATGDALRAVVERCHELHEERSTGLAPDERVLTVGFDRSDVTARYLGRKNHAEAGITIAGDDWEVETTIPLFGKYQAVNAGIAAALAQQVHPIDVDVLERGLRRATWPGRFEVMETAPVVILDGAHNPSASANLGETIGEFDCEELILVFGAMHEKDHAGMAAALPTPDRLFTCQPMRDRAEDAATLANLFQRNGVTGVETVPSVEVAVDTAISQAGPQDIVLVTGSLFTVAEARQRWVRRTIPKRIETEADVARALQETGVDAERYPSLSTSGLHEVIKTRLHPRQARWVEEEFRAIGGSCGTMGVPETIEEPRDVLLMGTRAEYETILAKMRTVPDGLGVLANQLERLVGIHESPALTRPWNERPAIMGILNVTPDSFHDGGQFDTVSDAVSQARQMVEDGADIIDIGGESTRPGADPVDPMVECERIIPVIEELADANVMISVDTRKANVARAALDAGANMLNDVSGLADPAMRFVAADYDVPLVVMHSVDTPVVRNRNIRYDDVVEDVIAELQEKILLAESAGLDQEQIIIDPGLGFGKSARESFSLLGRIGEFTGIASPIMVGHSHKSMFGIINCEPGERRAATIAGTTIAVEHGADIIRVHDVRENVAARDVVLASRDANDP